jgi:hypothetical protein
MPTLSIDDRCDAWYDGSAVCVIAVGSHGDPLDLAEHEAEALVAKLQACLKESGAEKRPSKVRNAEVQDETLDNEASKIQGMIAGRTVMRLYRPRLNEVALEFSDGTRLFIDAKGIPEFSIT